MRQRPGTWGVYLWGCMQLKNRCEKSLGSRQKSWHPGSCPTSGRSGGGGGARGGRQMNYSGMDEAAPGFMIQPVRAFFLLVVWRDSSPPLGPFPQELPLRFFQKHVSLCACAGVCDSHEHRVHLLRSHLACRCKGAYILPHIYTWTPTLSHTDTHICLPTHIYLNTHTNIHSQTHTQTHMHPHTHTHVHTRTRTSSRQSRIHTYTHMREHA